MIGQTINNYVLERKLGEGGMGDVYFARHNRIDRVVAIKVLHKNLFTNENIRTRFKNEANALIKLGHPNIVKIYDYVEQNEFACLIMEYIEGFTLDDYINKVTGPLSGPKATHIICNVLDAVQYAHDKNIFHRDIKPGNIMVSQDGRTVRIMDFSIAKFTDAANLKTTHANAQLGTPFYMSPEQVKGLAYSALSDIYSLGVTLFEMVTGKCPYQEITNLFELQSKIVNEPLPSTGKYYPNVTGKLQDAIIIATNKAPEQRFKSCSEFKAYLAEEEKVRPVIVPVPILVKKSKLRQSKPEAVLPEPAYPPVFFEEKKKNKSWVYLLGLFSILVIGLIVYAFINKPPKPPPPPKVERNITREADSLISIREKMMPAIILDSIKRIQLIDKLISPITDNNTPLINLILDSAFTKKPELIEPTTDRIINDLVGKQLSNGLIFTQRRKANITRIPSFIHNYNSAELWFKDGDSKSIYSVVIFYEKNDTEYVYQRNECKKIAPPVPTPIDKGTSPTQPDNPCKDAPPAPTNGEVISAFKNYLQQGGYKIWGIDYLEIDQISAGVRGGKGEPSTDCFNITFIVDFSNKGKLFYCQIKYTQKKNTYKPFEYKKL